MLRHLRETLPLCVGLLIQACLPTLFPSFAVLTMIVLRGTKEFR